MLTAPLPVPAPVLMSTIYTERCDLIPATAEFLELLIAREHLRAGKLLDIAVPDGWPDDADARAGLRFHLKAIQQDSTELLWRIRLILLQSGRTVVGSINLKGPPDGMGDVEVGWGVSAEFRRQGIATEAATAVITWAFLQPGVDRIIATIPTTNVASIHVAERLGMHLTAEFRRNLPVWAINRD